MTSPHAIPTMWVRFSTSTEDGQMEHGFALEVLYLNLYGMNNEGMLFDIKHLDGELERLTLSSKPYGDFTVGKRERIMSICMTGGYPAVDPITKAEFRERIGIGKLYDPVRGHFVTAPQ
jgi:hypothetical protein